MHLNYTGELAQLIQYRDKSMGWMTEPLAFDSQQRQYFLLFSKAYKQPGHKADHSWQPCVKFLKTYVTIPELSHMPSWHCV
jgi:hypothetical protein